MSTIIFPSAPFNGQVYPEQPVPGISQYRYNSQSNTWELAPSSSSSCCTTVSTFDTTLVNTVTPVDNLVEVDPVPVIYDGSGDQDERIITVPIGFDVQILGETYDTMLICSNGYLTFGGSGLAFEESSYNAWIELAPFPGIFVGAYNYSMQKITKSDPTGDPGQQVTTVRYQGSADYNNTDPELSDIFWEVTFHEDEPSKLFLNIIEFNTDGREEGVTIFTFSSTGVVDDYVTFDVTAGNQYEIELGSQIAGTDYTGSKITFTDPGVLISKNEPLDTVEINTEVYVKSDITQVENSGKIINMVAITQADYENIASPRFDTLYIILDNLPALCGPYNCETNVDPTGCQDLTDAWAGCDSLFDFPQLNVSSCVNFTNTWRGCYNLNSFPQLITNLGTNFSGAWYNCNSLIEFPLLDTGSGIDFSYTWSDCYNLADFPQIDTSSGENFTYAWDNCSSLTDFPLLDTSSGENFSYTWWNCSSLTSFPVVDTSSGTYFYCTWGECSSLTSFPLLDTSLGENFGYAWYYCGSLTSFPLLDTSSGTDFSFAWQGCSSLTSFPAEMFDNCPGNTFDGAWNNCALDQTSVDNILISLDTAGQNDGIVSIGGGTSSSPGVSGDSAKTSLEGKGWTVITN